MKRGLWVPPDELGDDPDTCDWALDDTMTPEDEQLPLPRPRRGVWLLAGGVCLGVPVALGVVLVALAATGGVLAYTMLGDSPPGPAITSLP